MKNCNSTDNNHTCHSTTCHDSTSNDNMDHTRSTDNIHQASSNRSNPAHTTGSDSTTSSTDHDHTTSSTDDNNPDTVYRLPQPTSFTLEILCDMLAAGMFQLMLSHKDVRKEMAASLQPLLPKLKNPYTEENSDFYYAADNNVAFYWNQKTVVFIQIQPDLKEKAPVYWWLSQVQFMKELLESKGKNLLTASRKDFPAFPAVCIQPFSKEGNHEEEDGKDSSLYIRVPVLSQAEPDTLLDQYFQFCHVMKDVCMRCSSWRYDAIEEVWKICKEKGILQDFLYAHQEQVVRLFLSIDSQKFTFMEVIAAELQARKEECQKEAAQKQSF